MEMLQGGEETRAKRILLALEDMTKPELVILCQNLEKTIQNREDDIDRINSHYEHLLSLYYEAEERLALLNQELFLSRAQSQTNYEWRTSLSTGESFTNQNGASKDSETARENNGDGDGAGKPTNSNKSKRTPSGSRNRQSLDFLSKTMTPVLHRRQNQGVRSAEVARSANVCARSESHLPRSARPEERSSKQPPGVSTSWSETYERAIPGEQEGEEETRTLTDGQQYTDDEDDDQDLGITINDNLNILTIDHGSSPLPAARRTTKFDVLDDEGSDEEKGTAGRRGVTTRVSTPFHGDRPLTAETAGSDDDEARPTTGERRGSAESEDRRYRLDHGLEGIEGLSRSTSGISWSLNFKEKSFIRDEMSADYSNKPPIGSTSPRVGTKSAKRSKGEKHSSSLNSYSTQTNGRGLSPNNLNRNSHNNNIVYSPDDNRCPSPALSMRCVAVGLGESAMGNGREDADPTDGDASRRMKHSDQAAGAYMGLNPSLHGSHRSFSVDSLAVTARKADPVSEATTPRARAIITDEVDQVYSTNRMKIRQNTGAVFGSYEDVQRAVTADDSRDCEGRYPGLVPRAPPSPRHRRPHTAAAIDNCRRRSRNLSSTFPPNRSGGAEGGCESQQGKPPSGASQFDVTRLRHRNRNALTVATKTAATSPRREQERSPSPLRVRAIGRPTSQSVELAPARSKNYSLNAEKLNASLDGRNGNSSLRMRVGGSAPAHKSVEYTRRLASATVQNIMANVTARLD